MLEVALVLGGAGLGWLSTWRENTRLRNALAAEIARIEHLYGLLSRREAPAETAWWMSDQDPGPPAIPENAIWDESGLWYAEPDYEDA